MQKWIWWGINGLIGRLFPQVRSIGVTEAVSKAALFLDVRTPAEYEVSHLKSAHRFTPMPMPQDRASPIIVYCAVGYRSAIVANQLQKAGYSAVFNLKGGIFQWVNAGEPVYRGEQKVRSVHPFSQLWGRLLHTKYRAIG
jgi:rhodanese-related sulfurtransferase